MRRDYFISIKPNLELEKYVDSYYFHSCDNEKSNLKYTYYPHVKHAVTIYKNSIVRTKGDLTIVKPKVEVSRRYTQRSESTLIKLKSMESLKK